MLTSANTLSCFIMNAAIDCQITFYELEHSSITLSKHSSWPSLRKKSALCEYVLMKEHLLSLNSDELPSSPIHYRLFSHYQSSILRSQLQLQVNLTECHQPLNGLMSYSIVYSKSQPKKISCIVYCIHLLFSLLHIMIATDSKSYVKPCV